MDFRFDWGEDFSKTTNPLNNSQDINKQSLGDQSSIMPADWISVMEAMPQRPSMENGLWQLESNGKSGLDSPVVSPMHNQTNSSSPMGICLYHI